MLILRQIATSLGSTEEALKLAITLFTAYGLAAVHHYKLGRASPTVQHLYCIACGLSFVLFNFGFYVYHSIISVVSAYLICRFIGGTTLSVVIAFVYFLGHLFYGYWFTSTDRYDILWTMPQCIIAMRMIGLVTDMYDGRRSKISPDVADSALKECPSFLELTAFAYFYGSNMVGPQFSIRRFRDFIEGKFDEAYVQGPINRGRASLQRLALGIVYMAVHVAMTIKYPTVWFLTNEFKALYLWTKWFHIMVWFRGILLRYQAVWLIAEGSCILAGLGYNGRNEKGEILLDAVRNIRMVKFEFGSSFQSIVESFNYNTNQWASKYVFKRLRFLGNKELSHFLTLLFLALWHGFYTGYLACFAFEFACVMAERQVWPAFKRNNCFLTFSRTPEILFPLWLVKKFFVVSGCAFGLLPFALLSFGRWFEVYKSIYFIGWIVVVGSPPVLNWLAKSSFIGGSKRRVKESHHG